jgi:hypothetical protein
MAEQPRAVEWMCYQAYELNWNRRGSGQNKMANKERKKDKEAEEYENQQQD